MRRQRIAAYRPELVVLPPELRFHPGQHSPAWSCTSKTEPNERATSGSATVECINIGVGVARNVVGTWHFDRQLAVEELSPLLASRGYSIWHSEEAGYSRIELEEGPDSRVSIVGDVSAAIRAPYLLQVQGQEHVLRIPLPPDFVLLLGLHLHCGSNDSAQLMTLQSLPPLILHLDFIDAGGVTRATEFKMRFHCTYLESTRRSNGREAPTAAEGSASVAPVRRRWLGSAD